MADDFPGLSENYAQTLHILARTASREELLPQRLRAVLAAELAKHLDYPVRVHIITTLTYAASLHEGVPPEAFAGNFAILKDLLLGDKHPSPLINDPIVQTALKSSDRMLERTLAKFSNVAPVVPIRPKEPEQT